MSAPAIRVDQLCKRYIIRHTADGRSGNGFRHLIQDSVTNVVRKVLKPLGGGSPSQNATPASEEFWALKDVSFDVKKGEVVGIIGRNGAGKSTLLKVLSRITQPTSGRIGVNGRVASLLEVGTGFHPELTGRENIFLNGAILGMSRVEVKQKFDEIVAFAGVERFLDTAVKYYSSGMYVRLAFAVAAHLEPEILIVDEVLAVGDQEFQKKCLGKMRDVTQNAGRTVLFVSHNLQAVAALCDSAVYLRGGKVVTVADAESALDRYRADLESYAGGSTAALASSRAGTGTHRIQELDAVNRVISPRDPMTFRAKIAANREEGPFHFSMHIRDDWDTEVFVVSTEYLDEAALISGDQELDIAIDSPWLPPGEYRVDAFLYANGIIDHWPDATRFSISENVARKGYSLASSKNAGKVLANFSVQVNRSQHVVC